MKEQDLPATGNHLIIETSDGTLYSAMRCSDGNFYTAGVKQKMFYKSDVSAWVYASDAIAAWKREQVRRLDYLPEDCISTADLHEQRRYEVASKILAADMANTAGKNKGDEIFFVERALRYSDILLAELQKPIP